MQKSCEALFPPVPLIYSIDLKKPTTRKDILSVIVAEKNFLLDKKMGSSQLITSTTLDNLNMLSLLDPSDNYSIIFTIIDNRQGEELSFMAELIKLETSKIILAHDKNVIMSACFLWRKTTQGRSTP